MSFLYKTFIVIIRRNEKGNCHKLIERESSLPHSGLYHPLIQELKWEKNGLIYSFKSKTKMLQNICFVKVQCVKFLCHNMRQQYVVFFITTQLNHLEFAIKLRL